MMRLEILKHSLSDLNENILIRWWNALVGSLRTVPRRMGGFGGLKAHWKADNAISRMSHCHQLVRGFDVSATPLQ